MSTQEFDSLFYTEDRDGAFKPPYVDGRALLIDGILRPWTGDSSEVVSPIAKAGSADRIVIGISPNAGEKEAIEAVECASRAYNHGRGAWPQMSAYDRIKCIERFLEGLRRKRDEIANIIMFEICKSKADAEKEVDRTIQYIVDSIRELKDLENASAGIQRQEGFIAMIKRKPLGVCLAVAPFNYPLNETYTTLIPALLMGNTCVLKTPKTGCLCHVPTFELFRDCFPPGVVNIISGAGRAIFPPIMKSGLVDILAFIGTSNAAQELQRQHPQGVRLRLALGLDAKNPAVVLADADLDVAVKECVLGSLSFNGQRCTALKIIFVHRSVADAFVQKFQSSVDTLKMGLPWHAGVQISPLAEPQKPTYLREVIADAQGKGARIVNARGGKQDRSFVAPTVLYPVSSSMRVYSEEQFGPLVPIVPFDSLDEVYKFVTETKYGQQASVFTQKTEELPELLDIFSMHVARININTQCQRSPDAWPFTARKVSAVGTLSVHDALRTMSIRVVAATKSEPKNVELVRGVVAQRHSTFVSSDILI